jgi:rhamnosyltransferase
MTQDYTESRFSDLTLKVNILMSTYNGEKFVAEQIESIQKQTFKDWNLIIRDDGSKDRTCEIIDSFVSKDARIRLIKAENVGVIDSFYKLVKMDSADFYFFADQDDYWLPEKIEIILKEAQKQDNKQPIMYYTDLKVTDKNLTVTSESMIRSQSDHANTQLVEELTENTVTGGASMINHALAKLWQTTDNIIMHDWYLGVLASAVGELVYIDQPTHLYRQHESNVLGARTLSKRMKKWLHPNLWFKKYWWLISSSQKQAQKLLTENENLLTEQKRQLIKAYVGILEQPKAKRRRLLEQYNLRKNKNYHTKIFRALIITKFAYKGKNK